MARLCNNGNEVARFKLEKIFEGGKVNRYFYSVRDNHVILRKLQINDPAENFKHDYGWKVFKRLKKDVSLEKIVLHFEQMGGIRV